MVTVCPEAIAAGKTFTPRAMTAMSIFMCWNEII
jgi:hypothetical protein